MTKATWKATCILFDFTAVGVKCRLPAVNIPVHYYSSLLYWPVYWTLLKSVLGTETRGIYSLAAIWCKYSEFRFNVFGVSKAILIYFICNGNNPLRNIIMKLPYIMSRRHILELFPFVTNKNIFRLFQKFCNYFICLPVSKELLKHKTFYDILCQYLSKLLLRGM